MPDAYQHLLVKEYKHWSVYLHENQGYLGRCILWCKREDAKKLTNATQEEQQELFSILKCVEKTLQECFGPDLLNFAFLGNEVPHLHCHIIPRYESERIFMQVRFNDSRFGKNYQTDRGLHYSVNLLHNVKNFLQEHIL